MTQPQAAILIVTFNSEERIGECLEAAIKTGWDVLVIDNGSHDRTLQYVAASGVRVIANQSNRGFAGAVNQGVRATTAPFLLLLNPDAVLITGADRLVELVAQHGIGAAAGKLVDRNGDPQKGFTVRRFPTPVNLLLENLLVNRIWPENPVNWRYRCLGMNLCVSADVEQPAGAFLMFRRDVWSKISGFDEGYFPIWFEDVDFCKRVINAGYRIVYHPGAIAKHYGQHSISQVELGMRAEYWYRSLLRYSLRHFQTTGRVVTCLGVLAGSVLRTSLGGPNHWSPAVLRSYGAVVMLAFRSIWGGEVQFGEILS